MHLDCLKTRRGAHKKAAVEYSQPWCCGVLLNPMAICRRKRQRSGGNTGHYPSIPCFSFSLNHTHTGFWVCDLKPSFLTLWGEVRHNHLKDDSEQEGRAEMDSEVLCCEPCSAPTFSSCQSHAGSLSAYPGHCLLKDEPGSGSFHGLLKLIGSSPEKQEMERCPWLLMRGELRIF